MALVALAAQRGSPRLFRAAALLGIGGFLFCMLAMWLPDIGQRWAHRDF